MARKEAIPCAIRLEDSWQMVKLSDNFLLEWLLFVDESTSAAALRYLPHVNSSPTSELSRRLPITSLPNNVIFETSHYRAASQLHITHTNVFSVVNTLQFIALNDVPQLQPIWYLT